MATLLSLIDNRTKGLFFSANKKITQSGTKQCVVSHTVNKATLKCSNLHDLWRS